jgi:nitroreductase
MEFYEVITTRRSVRAYSDRAIPEDVLTRVLNAARIAPSGSNRQPTRLILVRDAADRQALVPLCHGQKFVAEAPIVIVACGKDIKYNRGGYMGGMAMIVDVSIAVDHLTLAARAEGLGTCWIGSFDNDAVKKHLGIPADHNVVALTPLGYPKGDAFTETTDRLPLDKLVCEKKWRF